MYYSGKDSSTESMQSLGAKLRLERERQKIGIEKIAEDTRIGLRYLQAIEADDQSSLPGEFFYRAFVRQYSKYLGWNPDEIEKQINLVSSLPNAEPIESTAAPNTSLNLTAEGQISALRETLKDKPMRPPQDDGMSRTWLAFALLVIIGCAGYFGYKNYSQAPTQTAAAPPVQTAPPPVVTQQQQPVTTPAAETPKPAEPQPPAVTQPSTPVAGKFELTIRAKETTWIRLIADGAKIYGGTLDPGQERTVSAASAELIVGNAGTLDVIYNGKPLSYGVKGEVKTLLVSPEGWKYKPKPLPEATPTPTSSTTGDAAAGGTSPRAFE